MKKKFKVGVTNGCFDLLHKGHIFFLKQAKKYCSKLIVLLNSDSSVRKLKGHPRPIDNQKKRKNKLLKTKYVDKVIIFNNLTPLKKIKKIKPNVLFKGIEYKRKKISGKVFVKSYGGKVILLKKFKNLSTTKLIKKLNENNSS